MEKKLNYTLLIWVLVFLNLTSCNQKKNSQIIKSNQLEIRDIKLKKNKIDALISKDNVEVYWFLKPTVGIVFQYDGNDSILQSMESDENGEQVAQEYKVYYDNSKIIAVSVKNLSGGNGYLTYMYYYRDNKLFCYDYSLMNGSVGNSTESVVLYFDSNNNILNEKYDIDKPNGSKSHNQKDLNKPPVLFKNTSDLIAELKLSELLVFKNNTENISKSNSDLVNSEYFQGYKLKEDEKIVHVHWNMENSEKVRLSQDMNEGHYASSNLIVPNGKKWILLYAVEDYTYPTFVSSEVCYLNVDNEIEDFLGKGKNGKIYLENKNINISKAKDVNMKFYSGTTIKAISRREIGSSYGQWQDYKAELCFLEVNE